MTKDQVIRMHDGWYASVGDRLYGPWPMKQYAEAGLQVEIRRAKKAMDLHEQRGRERAKAEGRLRK